MGSNADSNNTAKSQPWTDRATGIGTTIIAGFTIVLAVVSFFQLREILSGEQDTKRLLGLYKTQADALTLIATATQEEASELAAQRRAQETQAHAVQRTVAMAEVALIPKLDLTPADLRHGGVLGIRNTGGSPAVWSKTMPIYGNGLEISFDHRTDVEPVISKEDAERVEVWMHKEGSPNSTQLDAGNKWTDVRDGFAHLLGIGARRVCTVYENREGLWWRSSQIFEYNGHELTVGPVHTERLARKEMNCPQ